MLCPASSFLALMVYSIIQRALRHEEKSMYLAGGKWSKRPTGCRVLERFHQIRVLKLPEPSDAAPHVWWCGRTGGDPAPTRLRNQWLSEQFPLFHHGQ